MYIYSSKVLSALEEFSFSKKDNLYMLSRKKYALFCMQIQNTVPFVQYFLGIFLCYFFILFLYHQDMYYLYNDGIFLLFIGSLQYSKKKSKFFSNYLICSICFILGYILSFSFDQSLLYLFITFFFSLILLTQKFIYFFLTTLFLNLHTLFLQDEFFILVCLFMTLTAFVFHILQIKILKQKIAYQQFINKKKGQFSLKNNIIKNMKVKLEEAATCKVQLNSYIKNLEFALSQHKNTFSMSSDLLEKQKYILDMTNKLTTVKTWEWDIIQGVFRVTNGDSTILRNDASIEQYVTDLIHPEDMPLFVKSLNEYLLNKVEIFKCEYRVKNAQDKWVWVLNIGQAIKRDQITQEPTYMVGIFQNIENVKQAEDQIKHTSDIINQIEVGIVNFDRDLHYLDANPFFYKMVGLQANQVIGKKLFDITDNYRPQQRSLHYSITDHIFKKESFDGEFEESFTLGNTLNMRCHIHAIKDNYENVLQYVGLFSDLTHYKRQEKRLSYLENYDVVTNLPNRFQYNYKTYQFLITHRDSINQVAIIRLAIDRFNSLNDILDSHTISQLLQNIAQRLRINNPSAFIIAYLNREDFVLVYELNHIQPNIQLICDQIIASFKAPFAVNGQEFILTVSVGVSIYPDHTLNFEQLNQYAQQALAHAQRLGGNTVQYYLANNNLPYIRDVTLENELYQAIENKELVLFFQPKINIETHTIFGFEALIRWNHPTRGIITPQNFLVAAQQTSLISEIGYYVLDSAAAQLKKWQDLDLPQVQLSVNIDAQQLYRGQLLQDLDNILEKYNIDGSLLEFELTETALIENTDYIQKLLSQIKERHIKLSLDDFGTGYSSLAYLTDFPFDILKIDKQFVQNLNQERKSAILNAIIAMGDAMNLTLIAEGVETKEQLEYFRAKKCNVIQGYIFSKPLNSEDATAFLQNFEKK